MSYMIEYDTVFLRTNEGITPCWLTGDNNVTTGSGRYERRARSWSVFCGMLGVSEEDLMAKVESMCCGSNENWKKGSRWVNDDGMRRWARNGCRKAYRIEDILAANGYRSYRCYVSTWYSDRCKQELECYVHDTEELDSWIRMAKAFIWDMRSEHHDVFPVISFSYDEPVKKPHSVDPSALETDTTPYLIKKGQTYLVKCETSSRGASVSWAHRIEDVKPLDPEVVRQFMDPLGPFRSLNKGCKLVRADSVLKAPWNCCIMVTFKSGQVSYVSKVTSRNLHSVCTIRAAKHYKDMSTAMAALKRLSKRKFERVVGFNIVEDPDVNINKQQEQTKGE